MLIANSLYFGHVIAHSLELHHHTHVVHRLEAAHIGLEGIGCARLNVQAEKCTLHALGTITHEVLHLFGIIAVQVQHLIEDVLIQIT